MNERETFRDELRANAQHMAAVSDGAVQPSEAFAQSAFDLIAGTGELSGEIYPCREHGAHANGAKYGIDGYCVETVAESDGFDTISVFIVAFGSPNQSKKLSKSELDGALKQATRFVSDAMRGYLSELERSSPAFDLAQSLSKNRQSVERVFIHLVTDSVCEHSMPETTQLPKFDEVSTSFRVWDVNRLFEITISEGGHTPIIVDFLEREGFGVKCLPMPSSNDDYECYLAILQGDVLANLYQEFGARLLESNVRAFLQQTAKVNKGIRDTIREAPQMFLPYNNGLTTTAKNVVVRKGDEGMVIEKIEDLQIVNGGQTTASLYHTRRKYKASLEDVYVQMKLTVLKDDEKFESIVPAISRFANSQNKVSELDLTANHRLLQELQRSADRTFALDPRDPNIQTLWFFERVKGQYREALAKAITPSKKKLFEKKFPKSQKIDKPRLAKAMMAYEAKPFWIARGAQKNYIEYIKTLEKRFPRRGKQDLLPGPAYWKAVVANVIIFSTFEKVFGRKGQNPVGDGNVRAPSVAYAMSLLHERTSICLNIESIWKAQACPEELLPVFREQLIWVYHRLIEHEGLVSERAKSQANWEEVKKRKDDPFSSYDWSPYLIDEEERNEMYKSWTAGGDETDANALGVLTNLGFQFWDSVCLSGSKGELSQKEYTTAEKIRALMKRGKPIDAALIKKGLYLLETLESRGVDLDELRNRNSKGSDFFDVAKALVRLRNLNKSDWNRILSFEQIILRGEKINSKQWQGLRNVKTSLEERREPSMKMIQDAIACVDEITRRFGQIS